MKIIKRLLPVFSVFLTFLSSCSQYYEVQIPQVDATSATPCAFKGQKPKKIYVYLDCSESVKGFFYGQSEVRDYIDNTLTDLSLCGDIPVEYYKFDIDSAKIANNRKEFVGNMQPSFFSCKGNSYSQVISNITRQENKDALMLIFTDGVPSIQPPKSGSSGVDSTIGKRVQLLMDEQSQLRSVVVDYASAFNKSISLFQYNFKFQGNVLLQPLDDRGDWINQPRNFFTIGLTDIKYADFLNYLLITRNTKKSNIKQQFNGAYNALVSVRTKNATAFAANKQVELELEMDSSLPYTVSDLKRQLQIWQEGQQLGNVPIDVNASKTPHTFNCLIDFSKVSLNAKDNDFYLVLNQKNTLQDTLWKSLMYPSNIDRETYKTVKHNKTYRLDILVDAFGYANRDKPVMIKPISIVSSGAIGWQRVFGAPYQLFLGQQNDPTWANLIYWRIFTFGWFWWAFIAFLYFYYAKRFDYMGYDEQRKMWFICGLVAAISSVIVTTGIAHFTNSEVNFQEISWGLALKHGFVNALLSFVAYTVLAFFNRNPNISVPFR